MRTQEKIDRFRESRGIQTDPSNTSKESLASSIRSKIIVLGGIAITTLGIHMIGLIDDLFELKQPDTKAPSAQVYTNLEKEFDIKQELAVETPLLLAAGVALTGYAYDTRDKK